MTSKHSSFLSLKEAVGYLTAGGSEKTDAQELLLEALREGRFRTRQWVWDEGSERYLLMKAGELQCGSGETSEWSDLLDEDIDWEQSAVAPLGDQKTLESSRFIFRYPVDKLEIYKSDFVKLLSEIEAKHDVEKDLDSVIKEKPNQRRRGRKPGDGAYDDSQHIQEMERLIKSGKAKSGRDAARQVVDSGVEIEGTCFESTTTRLQKKFSASQKQ